MVAMGSLDFLGNITGSGGKRKCGKPNLTELLQQLWGILLGVHPNVYPFLMKQIIIQ
jgi:hypothetical protein